MNKDTDVLTYYSGAVKALGGGKVGGHLVLFSTADDPDLSGEYFTADTDFGFDDGDKTAVLYHHGLDPAIGGRVLGKGTLKADDVGVWVEAQLALRDEYEKQIYKLAEEGKLGWSSGTLPHRVQKERVGKSTWIKSWPLALDASLTPTPCEPRTRAMPLKSLLNPADAGQGPGADGDADADQGADQGALGVTLNDQCERAIATLNSLVERLRGYAQMKARDGRHASKARHQQFKAVAALLADVIAKTAPGPDPAVVAMKLKLMREKLRRDPS